MKRKVLIPLLVIMLIALVGCMETDPMMDDLYTKNVYPAVTDTYGVGSATLRYDKGYFRLVYADTVNITGTIWEDLRTPINALKLSGVKPPTWTDYRASQVLAFADQAVAGNEQEVFFALQLPHNYKEGTDLYIHPHFVYSTNQINTRARWGMSYTWANLDIALPAEATIYANASLTNNDADVHRLTSFDPLDGAGKLISSMLLLKMFRNSSDVSDNYTDDVYLLEIDAHYLIDAMGSSAELIK